MIDGVGLFFGMGMIAGMCLTIVFMAAAVVLLALHNKMKDGDDEESI